MKNLQHRIQVNIAKKNGTKEAVVGSCIRRIREANKITFVKELMEEAI